MFALASLLTWSTPESDNCLTLITLESQDRTELQGIGATCNLPGAFNHPRPIVELLDGTYSRRIRVCLPDDVVVVPADVRCHIGPNTRVQILDAAGIIEDRQ